MSIKPLISIKGESNQTNEIVNLVQLPHSEYSPFIALKVKRNFPIYRFNSRFVDRHVKTSLQL